VTNAASEPEIKELENLINDDIVAKSAMVLEKLNSVNGQAFFGVARAAKKAKEQYTCDAVTAVMTMLPDGERTQFKTVGEACGKQTS